MTILPESRTVRSRKGAFPIQQSLRTDAKQSNSHASEELSVPRLSIPATTGEVSAAPLRGQAQVLGTIRAALDAGANLRGSMIIIRGDKGSGRSTVLGWAAGAASSLGWSVLKINGSVRNRNTSFAAMRLPLLSLLDRQDFLSPALRAALDELKSGWHNDSTEAEIREGVWRVLVMAARRGRILVAADDCQWLDPASLRLLAALANRLTGVRVVLIATTDLDRSSPMPVRTATEVRLAPLDVKSAGQVLSDRHPDLATTARAAVLTTAEGNPLALVDLPSALTAAQRSGLAPLPDPLAVGPALDNALGLRFRQLPTGTRALLAMLVLSDESTEARDLVRMAEQLGHDLDALAPAETAGLTTGDRVPRFTRRIYRSLAHCTATRVLRQQAYGAWAHLAVPHLDASPTTRDNASIGSTHRTQLEDLAHAAIRNKHWDLAIRILRRAADLSSEPEERARLHVLAATACVHGGWPQLALALTQEPAANLRPDITSTQSIVRAIARFDTSGDTRASALALSQAVTAGPVADMKVRDWAIFQLAALTSTTYDVQPARTALKSMPASTRNTEPLHIAVTAHLDPVGQARDIRTWLTAAAEAELTTLGADPYELAWLADAAWRVAETDLSSQLLAAALRHKASEEGAHLAHCYELQATLMVANGRWNEVHQLAAERLPDLMGRGSHRYAVSLKAQLMLVCAFQGRNQEARTLMSEVRQWAATNGSTHQLNLAAYAESLLTGQDGDSTIWEQELWHAGTDPKRDAVARMAHTDIIRNALLLGDFEAARHHQDCAVRGGLASFSPEMKLRMLHAEALLAAYAEEGTATEIFERAQAASADSTHPFDRARLALDHGKWLRRQRQPSAARTLLRIAYDTFTWLQAVPWRDQARAELRALGVSIPGVRSESDVMAKSLSAYEHRIAQMASRGMTNREIGQEMLISPRTVAAYLYRIFPRLGISSRREIGRVLGNEPTSAISSRIA
ncbi:AAA family ATPase [Streptomyces sp. NPDC002755]